MRSTLWLAIGAMVLATAAAFVAYALRPDPSPAPPAPPAETLQRAEPAVRQLISAAFARADASRRDADAWAELAMIYEAYGLLDLARVCYERTLALDDADPRLWYHLALMRGETGDVAGAIEASQETIARDNAYAPAHWRLGFWRLDEGDPDKAAEAFERALALEPDSAPARIGLSRAQLRLEQYEMAAALLEPLAADPSSVGRFASRLFGAALQRLGREDKARTHLARGEGATTEWSDPWQYEVVQYRRDLAWLHEMARMAAAHGRIEEAATLLTHLIEQHPACAELHISLANVHAQARRIDDAVSELERAAELAAGDVQAQVAIGSMYAELARALAPGDPASAHEYRARALAMCGRAMETAPDAAAPHGLRGLVLFQQNRLNESQRAYADAAARERDNPQWPHRAALVELARERWADAAARLDAIIEQWPEFGDAWHARGVALMKLGRHDEAEASLRKAESLKPDDPAIAGALQQLQHERVGALAPNAASVPANATEPR